MEIGTKLQQARIEKGLTLADIANVTKMSSHVLQMIETSNFSRLPGGLLTRGYLRAFASTVGLDPEEIVNEYRAEFDSPSPEDEPFKLPSSYQEPDAAAPGAALVLIIGLAFVIYFALPRPTTRPAETALAAELAEVDVDEATAITTVLAASHGAQIEPSPVRAADVHGLQIEVRPRAECWVSAVADGRLVIYRLMQAGERATIDARDEIQLRVGDAGAFAYVVNGAMGRSLGAPGEAVTVRITRDNVATWLAGDAPRALADDRNRPGAPAAEAHEKITTAPQVTGI